MLRQISELAALWLAFVASDGIASHEERYRRLQETEIRNGVKQIQTETQKAIEQIQAKTRKATRQIQAETQKGAQPIGVENQENIQQIQLELNEDEWMSEDVTNKEAIFITPLAPHRKVDAEQLKMHQTQKKTWKTISVASSKTCIGY
jgi:hypothetical protein